MTPTAKHPCRKNTAAHPFARLANYCFAVVFALCFVIDQAVEISRANSPSDITASLFSGDDDSKSGSQPADLPADADGEPTEKDADERKASEDSDDEVKISGEAAHQLRVCLDAKHSLLAQLKTTVDRRPGISLFILHHSWKSFIS